MPGRVALPPFQHRFVQTPDVRLHYAELDTPGKPLVLVHGVGMDWRVWQAISRRLAADFHLYLVDLRGHGESDKPARGYSLPHYAADLEDLLDQLSLADVALVGSSLGGMVAISVEAPADIVSHRILVDPPLTGGPIRDGLMFEEILRLKHGSLDALTDFLQAYNPGAGRYLMRMMAEMWRNAADGVIEEALADPHRYFDVDPALRGDESETLIMRADPALGAAVTETDVERTLTLLPHGHAVYVPGAGHAIHATKPVEFARLVQHFVGVGTPSHSR